MSHGGLDLLGLSNPVIHATRIGGFIRTRTEFSGFDKAFFVWELNLCAEIPRQNPFGGAKCPRATRDSPPKSFWRGKVSADNTRFPAKTNLAGKRTARPGPRTARCCGQTIFLLFRVKCHMNVLTRDTMQALRWVVFFRG